MSKKKTMNQMRADARRDLQMRAARIPSGRTVMDKKHKNSSRAAIKKATYKECRAYYC